MTSQTDELNGTFHLPFYLKQKKKKEIKKTSNLFRSYNASYFEIKKSTVITLQLVKLGRKIENRVYNFKLKIE